MGLSKRNYWKQFARTFRAYCKLATARVPASYVTCTVHVISSSIMFQQHNTASVSFLPAHMVHGIRYTVRGLRGLRGHLGRSGRRAPEALWKRTGSILQARRDQTCDIAQRTIPFLFLSLSLSLSLPLSLSPFSSSLPTNHVLKYSTTKRSTTLDHTRSARQAHP